MLPNWACGAVLGTGATTMGAKLPAIDKGAAFVD